MTTKIMITFDRNRYNEHVKEEGAILATDVTIALWFNRICFILIAHLEGEGEIIYGNPQCHLTIEVRDKAADSICALLDCIPFLMTELV